MEIVPIFRVNIIIEKKRQNYLGYDNTLVETYLTPPEKYSSIFEFGHVHCCKQGCQSKSKLNGKLCRS